MKTTLLMISVGLMSIGAFAGSHMVSGGAYTYGYSQAPDTRYRDMMRDVNARIAERERQKERAAYIANWRPEDPWRIVNGETNYAGGEGWYQFAGKVVDVSKDGVRIEGTYGKPPDVEYDPDKYNYKDFWVENFPYTVINDQTVGRAENFVAKSDGTYTYSTVNGGSRTIRKLNYFKPCPAPPPPKPTEAQINAAKAVYDKIATDRQTAIDNALKMNQKMADEGNAYGQLRMGERYLKGDGVEKDEAKARSYLEQSAAQGNITATDLLKKLNENTSK